MGLDARVYCDCFEQGRLLTAPLPEWDLQIDEDGCRGPRSAVLGLESEMQFDAWTVGACEHPFGMLLHHRVGNIAAVGLIRQKLSRLASRFPFLLTRVVYSGIHSGDFIRVHELSILDLEVRSLSEVECDDALSTELLREFSRQFDELIQAALLVKKPIAF